ncbi:MAG: cardiolipin synthase, partial [Fusobacteriaceae bacterium]
KIKEFKKSGIEVEVFFPSFFHFLKIANLRANYRDHKKITIIDGRIGYIGGFNIANEYLGRGKLGKWRDTALRIQGEVIHEIEREFFMSWNFAKKGTKDNMDIPKPLAVNKYKKTLVNSAQLVSSGPHFQLRTARDNFLRMIMEAKKTIYIQTPYFIPDDTIIDALKVASISGVNIKIIIPDKPDHFFVYWVNHSFAWELFEYDISFYRYKEGFIHSKVLIVDDEVATVGTVNFDYRSFYQNFEININLYGGNKIKELRNNFIQDLRVSEKLTNFEYSKRGNLSKFKESLFRLLAPML